MSMDKPPPFDVAEKALVQFARTDFTAFARLMLQDLVGPSFQVTALVEILAQRLTELSEPGQYRETISAPPRHGKSTLISVLWPAFLLGLNPAVEIVCASYVQSLADTLGQQTRDLMLSPRYRKIFPGTRFVNKVPAADDLLTTAGGRRRAVSIGGSLTGFGADVLIIDDPIPAGDAASAATLTGVVNWLKSTALNRLNDPARSAVVITQQRISPTDLIGHVKSGGGWQSLDLPAYAEAEKRYQVARGKEILLAKNATLWPERFPMSELNRLKGDMGEALFMAQYMQRPYLSLGPVFDLRRFKRFDLKEDEPFDPGRWEAIYASIDPAVSTAPGSSETAITVWGIKGSFVYLIDVQTGLWDAPERLRRVRALKPYCRRILIERCHPGIDLYDWLRKDGYEACELVTAEGSKEERAQAAALVISERKICLPKRARWLEKTEAAIVACPDGNADIVDSLSLAMRALTVPGFLTRIDIDPFHFSSEGKKLQEQVYVRQTSYYQRQAIGPKLL